MFAEIIRWILSIFGGEDEPGKPSKPFEVGGHKRSQAYGKGWGKRKTIKVNSYKKGER